jgi:NADH-quinone oxidoreductase subunit C
MQLLQVTAGEWLERARALRSEGWLLMDMCGFDALQLPEGDRFRIVCQLIDTESKQRRTVHVAAGGDPPTLPSVIEIWPTADFMEREAFDMFGINFEGHPNLTRILMPDEWEGHPLRKDYGVGKVAIDFVPQPYLQIEAPGQSPKSEEARVSVDRLGQTQQADKPAPSEDVR